MNTLAERQMLWLHSPSAAASYQDINEFLADIGAEQTINQNANPVAVLYYICMLQQEQIQALQEKLNDPS